MTQAITESVQESRDASDVFDTNKSAHNEGEATDSPVGITDDIEPTPENPQVKRVNKNLTVAGQSHCRFYNRYLYRQMTNIQWHLEIHQGKGIQVGNKQEIQTEAQRMFTESKASLTEARIKHNLKLLEAEREREAQGDRIDENFTVKPKRHVLRAPEAKCRKDKRNNFCFMYERSYMDSQLKRVHYNPESKNRCVNWNAFREKADLGEFKKVTDTADQKKSEIWALYGHSARVCHTLTDNDGKPVPPSRQKNRHGPETPEKWLVDKLVEAHVDYKRSRGQMSGAH